MAPLFTSNTPEPIRELSPASQAFVIPPPPKGTSSRPAKKSQEMRNPESSTNSLTLSDKISPPRSLKSLFLEHIESLNPVNEGILSDFTKRWILNPSSDWPSSSDKCIQLFMDQNRFYNPNTTGDSKPRLPMDLINTLKRGTEIEELQRNEWQIMNEGAMSRVSYLAQELHKKGILEPEPGTGNLMMTEEFWCLWQMKNKIWDGEEKMEPSTPSQYLNFSKNFDPESGDEIVLVTPCKSTTRTPRKTKTKAVTSTLKNPKSAVGSTTATPKVVGKTPLRRKADGSVAANTDQGGFVSSKRPRLEQPTRLTGFAQEPAENTTGSVENTPGIERMTQNEFSNIHTVEHVEPAQNPISKSAIVPPRSPAINNSTSNATLMQHRPMTPGSPIDATVLIQKISSRLQSTIQQDGHSQISTQQLNSYTRIPENPDSRRSNTPQKTRSPVSTPYEKTKPEKFLTFQNPLSRGYLKEHIPFAKLHGASLSAFFAFFSEKISAPLDSVDCITFYSHFAFNNTEVVFRHDTEEEWQDLKDRFEDQFKYAKNRMPNEKKYQIWVDAGDTSGAVCVEWD